MYVKYLACCHQARIANMLRLCICLFVHTQNEPVPLFRVISAEEVAYFREKYGSGSGVTKSPVAAAESASAPTDKKPVCGTLGFAYVSVCMYVSLCMCMYRRMASTKTRAQNGLAHSPRQGEVCKLAGVTRARQARRFERMCTHGIIWRKHIPTDLCTRVCVSRLCVC
jgi:hypothetical protein